MHVDISRVLLREEHIVGRRTTLRCGAPPDCRHLDCATCARLATILEPLVTGEHNGIISLRSSAASPSPQHRTTVKRCLPLLAAAYHSDALYTRFRAFTAPALQVRVLPHCV